ncbi:uncharacterized protein LOC118747756 [Rhagoletis pomonella]|uniref:uncharacterized protein LOC118747756 n=1 Tax=Rhagoletis pomonella TaxID=28610 RepID=UPI001780C675|nr:uncharacterized protein LOC118747756 [Rhagoletis pomonella]
MLHMEYPHQAIYAPLNQVITDSDEESEEEIHNSTKHPKHQLYHQKQVHQNGSVVGKKEPPKSLALRQLQSNLNTAHFTHNDDSLSSTILSNQTINNQTRSGPQPSSYTTNMQNTFRSVMMSDIGLNDQASSFSSFNSDYDERNHIDADNVAILGRGSLKDLSTHEPMSPARRCCFISSLLLCVFAIFGFVWLVPCNETCPAPVDQVRTHNWLNNYTKIELKGGVHIVGGLRSWENNLIFLYRGDAFFPNNNNAKRNGIISLIGSSGAVAWYDEMIDEPVAIDCTLIDVDRNGRSDCLVLGEFGELSAIDPISGEWHWHYKERLPHRVDALDFPVILPDLDGDGVLEILMVTSVPFELRTRNLVHKGELRAGNHRVEERNLLRILSGRNGKPIGDGFKLQDCDVVHKLQLKNPEKITFNCWRNNTEAQRSKTLADLFALITNKSIATGQKLLPASKIAQHRHYGQRKEIDAQRNIYSLSGRELVVENRGKCPDDCNVTFVLRETRNNKTTVLRNFTNSAMYGMVPAQWHFKNTEKEKSGFVIKFWKWNNHKETLRGPIKEDAPGNAYYTRTNQAAYASKKAKSHVGKENTTKTTKQNHITTNKTKRQSGNEKLHNGQQLVHEFPTNTFSAFDHLIQKRHTYTLPLAEHNVTRVRRSSSSSNLLLNNYKMQMITETVMLVIFVGAEYRIENTSQSNIVQFCRNDHNEVICQPDLNNQENSMLIADFDSDGSQELVSYSSTFTQHGEDPEDWKLVTYVRLLRLQAELPGIYGEKQLD